ncbi:unnamed protein product, partial [Mesorhabditis spiculigera]
MQANEVPYGFDLGSRKLNFRPFKPQPYVYLLENQVFCCTCTSRSDPTLRTSEVLPGSAGLVLRKIKYQAKTTRPCISSKSKAKMPCIVP